MILGLAQAGSWTEMLDKTVPSVLMIRSYAPRAFEGKNSGASFATGFVVDAERGIILTNRHVVTSGPLMAEAILQNNEEIDIVPIYRDPVHDFGFFKYNPADVRFLEMNSLALRPDLAIQGREIRLVGSDAGEKISILSGTLARLDREAPSYGVGRYNDFNTFYIQAASSSSGGSSGSPVLDVDGNVVALNAGSNRRAASSFFLPLERVKRALQLVQNEQEVTRGTLHTTFVHKPYDEAARYGLSPELEGKARKDNPSAAGVLVVDRVLRGGQADGALEPGDVLLSMNGQPISAFVPVEEILDTNVGKKVEFMLARGGAVFNVSIMVGDLHSVSPSAFAEIGGAVFHEYPYQIARHYEIPMAGIQVANRGYMLKNSIPRRSVITHINGTAVSNLDEFASVMANIADRDDFRVRAVMPSEPHRPLISTAKMDRRWFPARICHRSDGQRGWPCSELADAPQSDPRQPVTAKPQQVNGKVAQKLANGLVQVGFEIPYRTNGVYGASFSGVGAIVDASQGLVLVDRDTVTTGLGDVTVVFASSVEVPGEVVAIHPKHNLALVQYAPASIGQTPVTEISFQGPVLKTGMKAVHVGLTAQSKMDQEVVTITGTRGLDLPVPVVPFFRQTNLELISAQSSGQGFVGGVLADKRGRPSAFVASFPVLNSDSGENYWRGIPASVVNAFVSNYAGAFDAGVEWNPIPLLIARKRGLSVESAAVLENHDPEHRQALRVTRVTEGGAAMNVLEPGDILLSVNGRPATRISEWRTEAEQKTIRLRILREDVEKDIKISPTYRATEPFQRILLWGGAIFQKPHLPVSQQRGQPQSGVYVSYWWQGSPAGRHRLRPLRRIVSVDGVATPDLASFATAVGVKQTGDAVRLTTVDLKGRRRMLTMKADTEYWPLEELVREQDGWVRRRVEPHLGGNTPSAE